MTLRLGLFASHGGTNVQAILDACASHEIDAVVAVLICNNSNAQVVDRARRAGVPVVHLSSKTHPDPDALDEAMAEALTAHKVDLVALAGYMKKLGPKMVTVYRNRILNIHPAPLPRFGGKGKFGLGLHQEVIDSGVLFSAAVVHLVDEEYDQGPVVSQEPVPVLPDDTAEDLSARVRKAEHLVYPGTIGRIASGDLTLPD